MSGGTSLLARLGLHRPELRAWAMYDWANSVFFATIIQIFPIYFTTVAAGNLSKQAASTYFGLSTTVAMVIAAVISPVLGAVADYGGMKKKMLAGSVLFGAAATAALYLIGYGQWRLAALLFVMGNVGITASFVFYESFLPHIAGEDEVDRVSAAGYALGYLGGGLLLALNLLWIQRPLWFGLRDSATATRVSFLSAAVWWVVFSIPLFRKVPEPPRVIEPGETARPGALRAAFGRVGETLHELRRYRDAFLLLLAFLLYNDGIQTIIRMGTAYGTEIGLAQGSLIAAVLMAQFVAVPFAFLFGGLAERFGAKRTLYIPIVVYIVLTVIAYGMRTMREFFLVVFLVASVQGGSQAISRSLFSTMIPRHKSAEFFGFWGVFDKFAGVFGPAIFTVMVWTTGSSRSAILALIAFFVIGGVLLLGVDVERGRRVAREAEALMPAAGGA
ncbi:MAG TPA: MFS transporter [Vicinamibacteria bacterium]|jgi:UMF1 family MFS transporter